MAKKNWNDDDDWVESLIKKELERDEERRKKDAKKANPLRFISPNSFGSPGKVAPSTNVVSSSTWNNYANTMGNPPVSDSLDVIFWGYSGILANHYSGIPEGMTPENVRSRLGMLGSPIAYKIMSLKELTQMTITTTIFINGIPPYIAFEDAMSKLRIGKKIEPPAVYEEPENDEFDDDCSVDCKAGDHVCGK